ncbi:Hypothetical protein NTJ_15455 [Nesidiocoris tenuis]|uniref:Uncharacterized protein n=1 Tax=Nesidiocoris tenuis TaxID=355587 RepID=A0ABN7BFJ1_9HEMI|nr:Hypothetical protein NTJ_15455 [Nesidiocoris tenuis]
MPAVVNVEGSRAESRLLGLIGSRCRQGRSVRNCSWLQTPWLDQRQRRRRRGCRLRCFGLSLGRAIKVSAACLACCVFQTRH